MAETEIIGAVKISVNPNNLITKFCLGFNSENEYHICVFGPKKIRKLQALENLKWAQGSQWRKQRISNFTREIQLIFSRL